MTFIVRPLPCNYCISASCLHGTNLTSEWLTRQSSSGVFVFTLASKAKGGYFEHSLPLP